MYVSDDYSMPIGDPNAPVGECTALMAAIAATTTRMKVSSITLGNGQRHPAILTNTVATIDEISGGRVTFGFGAGWQENEHVAYGIPLLPVKQRLDRFEEAVQIVKGLLTNDQFSFEGEYYTITDASVNPKRANMPLLIGGGGEKRVMKIAARYADEWNVSATPQVMRAKLEVLQRHCDDVGRDRSTIHVSTQAFVFMSDDEAFLRRMRSKELFIDPIVGTVDELCEIIGQYEELGVDEFIVPAFALPPAGPARHDYLDRFSSQVASSFR